MERFNEMTQLFDSGDQRTFDDIYGDNTGSLFEDVDGVIDPRMIKLFEATYQTGNLDNKKLIESQEGDTYEKLFENIHQSCNLKEDKQLSDNIDWSEQDDLKESKSTFNEQVKGEIDQLQEEINKLEEDIPPGGHNFTGDESAPSGDGVPESHNKPGLGGSDPATVQSGQDYSHNTKFFESVYDTVNLNNKIDE